MHFYASVVQQLLKKETSLCESEIDAIREWSDDKTTIETHVLITVAKLPRTLTNY